MQFRATLRTTIVVLALSSPHAFGQSTAPANLLSVAETMVLSRERPIDSVPPGYLDRMSRANPAAIPQLFAQLEDDGSARYWSPTARVIGNVGGDHEADRLVDRLRALKGALNDDERHFALAVRPVLVLMANRGSQRARAILLDMCTAAFWRQFSYDWAATRPASCFTFANDGAFHTIESLPPGFGPPKSELIAALLRENESVEQRAILTTWATGRDLVLRPARPTNHWAIATVGLLALPLCWAGYRRARKGSRRAP